MLPGSDRQSASELPFVRDCQFLHNLHAWRFRKSDPAALLALRCLLEQFEALLAEECMVIEDGAPKSVHQMRVSTRKLRAALRVFKQFSPVDAAREFKREFKWLASLLGDVRDLDVHREQCTHDTNKLGPELATCLDEYQSHLAREHEVAREHLLSGLKGERYRQLKAAFIEFLQGGLVPARQVPTRSSTIRKAAVRSIGKQYQRVRRHGRAITRKSSDEEFHALRIDCKRLRYLLEFYREVYGPLFKGTVKRVKKLQDVLGALQDTCVASARLSNYADQISTRDGTDQQQLALRQLIDHQDQQAIKLRHRFRKVWKRFDRRGARKRLLANLVS